MKTACGIYWKHPGTDITLECTRNEDHDGLHEASDGVDILVRWSPNSVHAYYFVINSNSIYLNPNIKSWNYERVKSKDKCYALHIYERCHLPKGHDGWHVSFSSAGKQNPCKNFYWEVCWSPDSVFDFEINPEYPLSHYYSEKTILKHLSELGAFQG